MFPQFFRVVVLSRHAMQWLLALWLGMSQHPVARPDLVIVSVFLLLVERGFAIPRGLSPSRSLDCVSLTNHILKGDHTLGCLRRQTEMNQ